MIDYHKVFACASKLKLILFLLQITQLKEEQNTCPMKNKEDEYSNEVLLKMD